MNSLVEVEEKIEEIFCKRKLNDHIEQYGLIRLTEMAFKLVEDLERHSNKSKEVYLCKLIIEFLIGLVRNSTTNTATSSSPKYPLQQSSSNDDHLSSALKSTNEDKSSSNAQSASNNQKRQPPLVPKKPVISRNFHSFQYNLPGKDGNQTTTTAAELGASNTSLSTTISNSSLSNNQNKNKQSPSQSITATRTVSTFASISKNGSKHQFLNQQKLNNTKYTETCLDKDTTQFEENAYEIKDLGFGSKPTTKLSSTFGANSKLLNNNKSTSASTTNQSAQQSHNNSYPRQLPQQPTNNQQQQLRTGSISSTGNKKVSNFFQLNQQNANHFTPGSLKDSLSYGSTDALCKNSSNATNSSIKSSFFSRKGSLDKHSSTQAQHAYLPDFGRRNLRLSEDLASSPSSNDYHQQQLNRDQNDEDDMQMLHKSLDDNNGELNFENNDDTEDDLDKRDVETEDEAIYDTVAPDELNSCQLNQMMMSSNSTNNHMNNKLNSSNLKSNLVKSLKNSFENRPLNQSMENLDINNDGGDNRIYSNYVNIDYFLRSKNDSDDCDTQMSQSLSSDHDIDESIAPVISKLNSSTNNGTPPQSIDNLNAAYDEVFECRKEELKNSKSSILSTQYSMDSADDLDDDDVIRTEAELLSMYRSIIQNIIDDENVYIDCLDTLIQYKKALKSSTESTQPLLKPEQLECIFYQIPELFKMHSEFIVGIKELSQSSGDNSIIKIRTNTPTLGDLFKNLASQLDIYSKYLRNYSNALETLRICCQNNEQFNGIAMSIKLKSKKVTTTLQELLHKPVARVQKNALVLHDLLKYTQQHSEEYKSLQTALQMTQTFLNDLNIAATENLFPAQDKTQRRLVKESFIIELSDGKRKLRHLILFNDILVCAKYKPSSRQKFTFELKWYASLADITLPDESSPIKENSGEIMTLRSKVSINRDEIYKVEKSKPNSKLYEKLKKKQADLEGQLVLLLPQLQFSILHNKNSKHYTFYLSSEFERTQWIESIRVLQQSATNHEQLPVNVLGLQAWIETCRKNLNPNVGSFLLRSIKDEELLYGDLYLNVIKLSNFKRSGEFFLAIETDTYGHFFQKMSTKSVRSNPHSNRKAPFRTNTMNSNNSTLSSTNSFSDAASTDDLTSYNDTAVELHFDQEFVLDLDGTQIIRFLLFEEIGNDEKPIYRGKASIEFSRNWLKDKVISKEISIANSILSVTLKFISSESSTIRFPAGKVYGAFGVPIQTVTKKEKSEIPYLIVGCVREVERRGMKEIGIYRVSGLSSDVQKLKKAFEVNPYEAEHLLKEIDIHAVTGLLKLYLRELPEALFTNALYKKFFDAFGILNNEEKSSKLIELFLQLPLVNQNTINFIIEHLTNVNNYENYNKMSLNNLATVFGPTMIFPNNNSSNLSSNSGNINSGAINSDQFTAGTIDVMKQSNLVYFFLRRKSEKLMLSNE